MMWSLPAAMVTVLALGSAGAQGEHCDGAPARAALRAAAADLARLDDDAAAAGVRAAWAGVQACPELVVALDAIDGWIEARGLAAVGGAPDRLGAITAILARLEQRRSSTSVVTLARLAAYAEAVLRAAVAAAQDERDEMQVYLAHARTTYDLLRLTGQETAWPLPMDEVEGELWFEVDRWDEARAAYERAAAGGSARALVGLGRVFEKQREVAQACVAYRRADSAGPGDEGRRRVREALDRLGCLPR